MELKLSFGTCKVEDQKSSSVNRFALRSAVVAQEYQNRLSKTKSPDVKHAIENEFAEILLDLTYKRQALYITEHSFDLDDMELWMYLREHSLGSDSNKLTLAIDDLGNELEVVRETMLSTSLVKDVSLTDTRTSDGVSLTCSPVKTIVS